MNSNKSITIVGLPPRKIDVIFSKPEYNLADIIQNMDLKAKDQGKIFDEKSFLDKVKEGGIIDLDVFLIDQTTLMATFYITISYPYSYDQDALEKTKEEKVKESKTLYNNFIHAKNMNSRNKRK